MQWKRRVGNKEWAGTLKEEPQETMSRAAFRALTGWVGRQNGKESSLNLRKRCESSKRDHNNRRKVDGQAGRQTHFVLYIFAMSVDPSTLRSLSPYTTFESFECNLLNLT